MTPVRYSANTTPNSSVSCATQKILLTDINNTLTNIKTLRKTLYNTYKADLQQLNETMNFVTQRKQTIRASGCVDFNTQQNFPVIP